MIAASAGRTQVCRILLEEGADPRLEDLSGQTAAMLAREAGHSHLSILVSGLTSSSLAPKVERLGAEADPDDDLGGWEPEVEIVLPTIQHVLVERTNEVQDTISAFRPNAVQDEWSLVEVALPAGPAEFQLHIPDAAKMLMADGFVEGAISGRKLRSAWTAATTFEFQLICTVMREAGVLVTFGRNDKIWNGSGSAAVAPSHLDAVDAVVAQAQSELAQNIKTVDRYLKEIGRNSSLSPDRERRIFIELSSVNRELVETIAVCARMEGLTNLLSDERTSSHEDSSEPDQAEEEELLVDPAASETDVRNRLPFEIACRLLERLRAEHSNPDVKNLKKVSERYRRLRDKAMEGGLKLVPYWANKYRNRGLPQDDLIQEGNLGLMRAAEKFDLAKGARFGAYATYWIRQSMLRAIEDQSRVIRIPVHFAETIRKATHFRNATRAGFNRDATVDELAFQLECSKAAASRLLKIPYVAVRSVPLRLVDEAIVPADVIPQDKSLNRLVSRMLTQLQPREERILRLRFGLGGADDHTLEEVGLRFDVTRERVRQIEAKALRKLRHPGRSKSLQAAR